MDILVTIHLVIAIAVALAALIPLVLIVRGGWSDGVGAWMGRLALLATIQWILGFFVWFGAVGDGFNAFTGLIHPVAMTGILGLAHAGNARAKSEPDLAKRARSTRTFLIVIVVILALLAPWPWPWQSEADGDGGGMGGAGVANPASTYCVEQGGEVEIVDEDGGQVGYCVLPDGTRVEEWEYYRSMNPDAG